MTWGEAAWTSRDLTVEYLLLDHYGAIHGEFPTEAAALERREYLNAEGIECWLVQVEPVTEPAFLTDRDPGDETTYRGAPCS